MSICTPMWRPWAQMTWRILKSQAASWSISLSWSSWRSLLLGASIGRELMVYERSHETAELFGLVLGEVQGNLRW